MRRLAPALLLMAVLAALAATPGLNSGLGVVDDVGRKVVHVVGYAALFLLCRRALGGRRGAAAAAAGMAVAFAVVDETIQAFTPGRKATPLDVLIDASGVALAYVLVRRTDTRTHPAAKP